MGASGAFGFQTCCIWAPAMWTCQEADGYTELDMGRRLHVLGLMATESASKQAAWLEWGGTGRKLYRLKG